MSAHVLIQLKEEGTAMLFTKYKKNPILAPKKGSKWEGHAVCNPGAIRHKGKVYMLYRASGETDVYRIYFGLAVSENGYDFKRVSDKPNYTGHHGFDSGCVEDPRIVKMADGYYYITYAGRVTPFTSFVLGEKAEFPEGAPKSMTENYTRTGLMRTKNFKDYENLGAITPDNIDDRDVVIFPEKIKGKYVMFRRPAHWVGKKYGTDKPGMWISYSKDLKNWSGDKLLAKPATDWDYCKIGASTPPIKTRHGWLVMYHGVDKKRIYRQGLMLLDLNDPTKILSRPPDFIMEPTEKWEITGVEHDVVFAVGNLVIGDKLFVYYGGADKVIGVATAKMKDVMDYVLKYKTTKKAAKKKVVKKKAVKKK
jgi:beta-1,2-mannobiose phosphorylase / 1,2-beta-oligomannan phosphorylase